MMILNLYKNGKLSLTLNGSINDNKGIFDNIIYDIEKMILIREDNTYKYVIDFKQKSAILELKEYKQTLPLVVKNIKIEVNNNKHKIAYNIESEEDILNELEVIF